MAWVQHNLAKGKSVRGAIIAKEIPDDLKLACSRIPGVGLYQYALQVKLTPVKL
jgi:hypothetical protein